MFLSSKYLINFKRAKTESQIGQKWLQMHPGALKIVKFYPDLALRAKMAALLPSVVPAIDTFVPATSNLNKNPENGLFL